MTHPAGRVRRCSKYHGSGRVGSGRFGSDRVGSDRVGSNQEVFKSHGSSRVALIRPDPREVTRPVESSEGIGTLAF